MRYRHVRTGRKISTETLELWLALWLPRRLLSYLALQSSPVTLAWTSGTGPGRIMAALLEHRHGTNPTLHTTSSRDTRSLAVGAKLCSLFYTLTVHTARARAGRGAYGPLVVHSPAAASVGSGSSLEQSAASLAGGEGWCRKYVRLCSQSTTLPTPCVRGMLSSGTCTVLYCTVAAAAAAGQPSSVGLRIGPSL